MNAHHSCLAGVTASVLALCSAPAAPLKAPLILAYEPYTPQMTLALPQLTSASPSYAQLSLADQVLVRWGERVATQFTIAQRSFGLDSQEAYESFARRTAFSVSSATRRVFRDSLAHTFSAVLDDERSVLGTLARGFTFGTLAGVDSTRFVAYDPLYTEREPSIHYTPDVPRFTFGFNPFDIHPSVYGSIRNRTGTRELLWQANDEQARLSLDVLKRSKSTLRVTGSIDYYDSDRSDIGISWSRNVGKSNVGITTGANGRGDVQCGFGFFWEW